MATITYTYNGGVTSNTSYTFTTGGAAATKDFNLSLFTASGDTDKVIGSITSVTFQSTFAGSNVLNRDMKVYARLYSGSTQLGSSAGSYLAWDSSFRSTITHTITGITAAEASAITKIQLACDASESGRSSTVYYRLGPTQLMTLTINFTEPSYEVYYYRNGSFQLASDCKVYSGGAWKAIADWTKY